MPVPAFVAHLLTLAVVAPVLWDRWFFARLKRARAPQSRVIAYGRIMAWQWVVAIAIVARYGLGTIGVPHVDVTEAPWMPPAWLAVAGAVLFVGGMLGRAYFLSRHPARTKAMARALDRMHFFLPQDRRERFGWAGLAITSGICEEVMFRGYLVYYLHTAPWHLGIWLTLAVTCALFGLGHLYQGVSQALRAIWAGALFFLLFLATGGLLLPIAVHVFYDLYVLVTMRVAKRTAPRLPARDEKPHP